MHHVVRMAASSTNDAAVAFLWAIAGILLGGTFTYIAARLQVRHAANQNQRDRLLGLRTDSFRRLWQATGSIQRRPDPQHLEQLPFGKIVQCLNSWYFNDGGLYLTEACRSSYFTLLDELDKAQEAAPLDLVKYQPLYLAASRLRDTLARELETRSSIIRTIRARR